MIAAGIRGLIVAGGKYTGPAMNPMIAFGWAFHTGAYKVYERAGHQTEANKTKARVSCVL